MKLLTAILVSGSIAVGGMGTGFAQAPATTPGSAATKPATTNPVKPMSAEKAAISKACSQQADEKKLHGKDRKKFRSACKRNGGKPA
jgi:hypothetical protein